MKQPHKHAELIKAWADGAEIEYLAMGHEWKPIGENPQWFPNIAFRTKPEPKRKPDVMTYYYVNGDSELFRWSPLNRGNADLRIIS